MECPWLMAFQPIPGPQPETQYLEDHPRTCKWLITMVIVSKSPKWGYGTPSKWPNFMASTWGLLYVHLLGWSSKEPSVRLEDSLSARHGFSKDKSSNGHRYDSIPIANGMINSISEWDGLSRKRKGWILHMQLFKIMIYITCIATCTWIEDVFPIENGGMFQPATLLYLRVHRTEV